MRVATILPLLAATTALASVIPNFPANSELSEPHTLVKRQGHCHDGDKTLIGWDDKLVCISTSAFWVGAAITAIGTNTVETIASRVTDWIASSAYGQWETSQGRLTRREEEEEDGSLLYINIGGVEAGVPFTQDSEGKTTINVVDFFTRSRSSLDTRDVSDSDATVIGGTATYYSNGTLDTFTLDFSLPSTAPLSDSASPTSSPILTKRDYWTLHTTYWANPANSRTSLNWNSIHSLVLASYRSLPNGVSQVCGYMANSGTWHGAFRHWTGDRGYQIGQCDGARIY